MLLKDIGVGLVRRKGVGRVYWSRAGVVRVGRMQSRESPPLSLSIRDHTNTVFENLV